MSTPSKQKALVLPSPHAQLIVTEVNVPKPGPGEILVKVQAASLNPVDWLIQKFNALISKYPAILGVDPAGDVVALGEGVKDFEIGDKVFFQAIFDNRRAAYQQYTIAKSEVVAKIPLNMNYDTVVTFPCAGGAAYLGLFDSLPYGLGLPNPLVASYKPKAGQTILIIGGSSTVGQFAIQFAKLAGISTVIVTASQKHTAHLVALGATHVVDRFLPPQEIESKITEIMDKKPLTIVLDTISQPDTQKLGYDLISTSEGGNMAIVMDEAVKNKVENKKIGRVSVVRENPEDREDMRLLYSKIGNMLSDGTVKPPRLELLGNGLAGVPAGLQRIGSGQVSGTKLVVHPPETP